MMAPQNRTEWWLTVDVCEVGDYTISGPWEALAAEKTCSGGAMCYVCNKVGGLVGLGHVLDALMEHCTSPNPDQVQPYRLQTCTVPPWREGQRGSLSIMAKCLGPFPLFSMKGGYER